jgi:flagellar M-ring protein FliF
MKMGGFLLRLKQWWERTDRTQRMVTIGGALGLLVLFAGIITIVTRPKYEILYANLSEQDQAAVVTELQNMGIDCQFDHTGTVEVPSSVKNMARIKLAAGNKLPKAQGQWGLSELNSMNSFETPSVEQERLKAITEGEIAKSIEAMDGIESARVHLTLPEKSPFAAEQKPGSASISIVESSDSNMTAVQGRTIAMLVKNAVDGLDAKGIVVVNQHLQMIWNGEDEQEDGSGGSAKKADLDEEVSLRRQRELQTLLDNAFGQGAAMVTVHADVDMDPTHTVSDLRTPSGTSDVQTQSESVNGGVKPIGGIAGLNGQIAAPGVSTAQNPGNYTGKNETKEAIVSEVQTEKSKAIGGIRGMSINAVVDSTRGVDASAVQSILVGDLGDRVKLDAKGQIAAGQPYSVTVTPVEFDKTAAKADAQAASAASSQQHIQQLISMLPIIALLIVGLVVFKQITKFAKGAQAVSTQLTLPEENLALSSGPAVSALSNGELSHLLEEIESTGGGGRNSILHHIPEDDPHIEVENIKNRVHIPLEQLKKLAQERPALVAMLIKSMILEERK